MYKSVGRRKVEYEIFEKLRNEFCNSLFFQNPRIIDVVDHIEKVCVQMYQYDATYITSDLIYIRKILPRIQMLLRSPETLKVNEQGNIRISLPLLQEDERGNQMKQKDVQYNIIKEGMEKVTIWDYRRYGLNRIFKSTRYVYDQKGIERQREIEMLNRDEKSVKTTYCFQDRLEGNPHIVRVITNSKPMRQKGQISYYDIQHSRNIEDLDVDEKHPIQKERIKELTEEQKKEIVKFANPIYQKGIKDLMGLKIEQEVR